MKNWYKEFERDTREQERNQELRRQNDLLNQQSWEQKRANEQQQAALEDSNRIAREQQQALEERNRLERQRQWEEESRYQRELELRYEQEFKDRIFDLKKLWASSQTDDERGRVQILLAEAEAEYQAYLQERAAEEEQRRIAAERYQLKLAQQQKEDREKREIEEAKQKRRSIRNGVLGILCVVFLLILGTRLLFRRNHTTTLSNDSVNKSNLSQTKSSQKKAVSQPSVKKSQSVSSISQPVYTKVDYEVEVLIDNLALRDTPSINGKNLGTIGRGWHQIVETTEADGYKWGLLKSRIGWIALDYTGKVTRPVQSDTSISAPSNKQSITPTQPRQVQPGSASSSQNEQSIQSTSSTIDGNTPVPSSSSATLTSSSSTEEHDVNGASVTEFEE